MSLNEAALRRKVIEQYALQVQHFRLEAAGSTDYDYASSCNEQAVALLAQMSLLTVEKIEPAN
jgi:hypothetical protein